MKQTEQEQPVAQQSPTNAENATESKDISSNEILRVHSLEKPIDLIECHNGWFLALGRTRLSQLFPTREMAEAYTTGWEFAINLMIVINGQCKDVERLAEQTAKARKKSTKKSL